MTGPRPRLLAAVGVALLLTAATSCSSGSSDAADSKATTSAPTSSPSTTASSKAGTDPAGGTPLARYAGYRSKSYDDRTHWVCRPDTPKDPCHGDLDATSVAADGTLTVEPFHRAQHPKVDCFYVYPTISNDKGAYSDWNTSPDEEGFVTVQQAARLASTCRVFAPVYRQGTLTGITSRLGGGTPPAGTGDPYADVLDAFRTYMAQDNDGRGVVLVGHSQGTAMLIKLIKDEIDPNPDVRAKLVGAYLAGGSVGVPAGKTVGGSFANVPLCSKAAESGCIYTWSTFRSTAPPPADSFFGRVRGGATGQVAGCVNPAAPAGGSADARSYFPSNAGASILKALGAQAKDETWVDPDVGKVTTPFVTLPGLVSVACTSSGDFSYLEATVHGDPSDPRADDISGDLTPQWGLHLVDVNLVMGNVQADVAAQAKAYAASH